MKMYKVFRSEGFKDEIARYDKNIQDRIDKIEDKLMTIQIMERLLEIGRAHV